MSTRYLRVKWIHDHPDEPVRILSEIRSGFEVRKVEEYADGRRHVAPADPQQGTTFLADVPMPAAADLAQSEEFEAEAIPALEFERAWREATQA